MPYEIKRRGDEHCVYKEGDDEPVPGGCHATPEEAGKHKAALDAAMRRRGEMLSDVIRELEGRGIYGPFGEEDYADRAELQRQREARSKRYGISVKAQSNLTPPQGYPEDPGQYGDPVNLRYPADAEHAMAGYRYFNQDGQREKGGYASAEWAIVGERLAKLCSRNLRGGFAYKAGKIVRTRDGEESSDRVPFVHEVPFGAMDEARQITFGIVAEPDTVDAQGHKMSARDIEKACHDTMRRLQAPGGPDTMLDAHHSRLVSFGDARIIEMWIQREPVRWRLELSDGAVRETDVKPGSWCMATEYGDELWAEVLNGEITGYSPAGWGILTRIED